MTLLEDGNAPSKIRQGVTTEVLGEDSSAGPASGKRQPRAAFERDGKTRTWTTLGGYFDALEAGASPPTSPAMSAWERCWNACWETRSAGPTPSSSRR